MGAAVLDSFGLYFIPLVGPHAAWFAVALTAQLGVGLALYWSLGGSWTPRLGRFFSGVTISHERGTERHIGCGRSNGLLHRHQRETPTLSIGNATDVV